MILFNPRPENLELFGLRGTQAMYSALAIFISYGLYLLGTSYWLQRRKNHYLLLKSHTAMAILAALLQYILLISHFWRFFFAFDHLPGTLTVWRNYVFFPLYILFSFQGRGMHLLFEYLWTKSIDESVPKASAVTDASGIVKEEGRLARLRAQMRRKIKNPVLHVWLKNYGSWIMAGVLAGLHVFLAFVLPYLKLGVRFWTNDPCPLEVEAAGVLLSVTVYLIIWCPIMLVFLADVKDAYGLCRDLQLAVSYAVPFYSLYIVMRSYDFLQPLRHELPASIFMLAAMAAVHTATVTRPLIRTLSWRPEDVATPPKPDAVRLSSPSDSIYHQRPISIELVLDSPELFPPLAAYSKNAFAWDSILFHQAVQRFHQLSSGGQSVLSQEGQLIYDQYIARGASCEMNLSYPTAAAIHEMIAVGWYSVTMFDEAHREVLRLVSGCTYRNFLYTLPPSAKARYMVPFVV